MEDFDAFVMERFGKAEGRIRVVLTDSFEEASGFVWAVNKAFPSWLTLDGRFGDDGAGRLIHHAIDGTVTSVEASSENGWRDFGHMLRHGLRFGAGVFSISFKGGRVPDAAFEILDEMLFFAPFAVLSGLNEAGRSEFLGRSEALRGAKGVLNLGIETPDATMSAERTI